MAGPTTSSGRGPARRGLRRASPVPLKVVALGGGHGLSASLQALRHVTGDLTAVVTVADDGGSSGRLRDEFGVLPPGDLRMALSALCNDSGWGHLWRDVLQHRFSGEGPLAGHAVGNLLIVALWQLLDDPSDGLSVVGELLGARGRVLPMSLQPLTIEADVDDAATGRPEVLVGQNQVAATTGRVGTVRLVPADPPANPEAVQAVMDADWVVLGPGSWFTSVCTHLLVPELARALQATPARRCVTLNLDAGASETAGYRPEQLLETLGRYAPDLTLDAVVADPSAVEDVDALSAAAARFGAVLVMRQVAEADGSAVHHPLRLAAAYADVFSGVTGDVAG
ncbi:uridine diphosphate-N-acetylglucosamine-binding protein YvcK [Jannaschia sp. R86511]|uniref:gluconeogenesis factor YvcK family protein n=1 Tax=Jannaschia sp. R86511 TaxID=3093853 RepID=UPI0036D3A451